MPSSELIDHQRMINIGLIFFPTSDDIEENDAIVHIFLNSQVYRRVRVDLLTSMVNLVCK